MTDAIEIGTDWEESGIVLDDGFDMELTVESGFDVLIETECVDESEIHLIIGDIVEESLADNTEYDFEMEFADMQTAFVYVGPDLAEVDVGWSNDAWFHSEGWFRSEAW